MNRDVIGLIQLGYVVRVDVFVVGFSRLGAGLPRTLSLESTALQHNPKVINGLNKYVAPRISGPYVVLAVLYSLLDSLRMIALPQLYSVSLPP